MSKDWTTEKLFDEICELEVRHNLFEKAIDGVYIWKLIRFGLYRELAEKIGLYGNAHPGITGKTESRHTLILKRLKNRLLKSPFCKGSHYDAIIFTHPRKVTINETPTDIYSSDLEEELRASGQKVLAIERTFSGEYLRPFGKEVAYSEPFSLYEYYVKLYYRTSSGYENQRLKLLHNIDTIAGIPVKSITTLSSIQIRNHLIKFKSRYHYHRKIFKKLRPRNVYVLVSYGYEPMITAAQEMGIPVTEVQHGTILKQHIGYSYPRGLTIPYFPDNLLMWGKFWFDNATLPIEESAVTYTGFSHMNKEIAQYKTVKRNHQRVLFISQGPIAKELLPIVLSFAKENPEYQVIYRLHPSEDNIWHTIYPELGKGARTLTNLQIEHSSDRKLYKSFALSEYVVGVSSTALMEAIAADCKLILCNLPGVEHYRPLTESKQVPLVQSSKDLAEITRNYPIAQLDKTYIFSPKTK